MSEKRESYLKNCNIIMSDDAELGTVLFYQDIAEDGPVEARLDGYTILPTEQYDEMKDFMEREGIL